MSNDKGNAPDKDKTAAKATGAATTADASAAGSADSGVPADKGATGGTKKTQSSQKKGADKPAAQSPASAAPRPGTGRVQTAVVLISTLAFLLSLGVGGALFYLWQQGAEERAVQLRQMERHSAALENLETRLARQDGVLEREAAAREEQAARTGTRLATVEQGLTRIQDRATRQERGWQLAEVKHLQRMATHRLRLMDDPEGALRALQAADEILVELGDPRLLPVREALAGEIQALQDMERPDLTGIALRLERLAGDLRPLPLRGQAPIAGDVRPVPGETPAADAPWWLRAYAEIREALSEHIAVRRHAEPIRALPDAETELFLRQLLTLRVEAARVAVLRRDDAEYQRHLAASLELLDDHFDAQAAGPVRERLESLKGVTLRPPAPDISGSFTRLDELEG